MLPIPFEERYAAERLSSGNCWRRRRIADARMPWGGRGLSILHIRVAFRDAGKVYM